MLHLAERMRLDARWKVSASHPLRLWTSNARDFFPSARSHEKIEFLKSLHVKR